jgi:hypothetical protein
MKNKSYSRKRRQLGYLFKLIKRELSLSRGLVNEKIKSLWLRCSLLIKQAGKHMQANNLKKAGVIMALLGLHAVNQESKAQWFDNSVLNPFGLNPQRILQVPAFADLDNDGDQDLLAGAYGGGFLFYRNSGTKTNPSFEAARSNPFGLSDLDEFCIPSIADIDGDGDLDILASDYTGNLSVFRNNGTASAASFNRPVKNPFGLSASLEGYPVKPVLVDIDGDGDLDLFTVRFEYYGTDLKFYKNIGTKTAPAFDAPVSQPFQLTAAYIGMPTFGDLDKDGDLDLLTYSYDYDAYAYFFTFYKNTGSKTNPVFDQGTKNPYNLGDLNTMTLCEFVDIDGDADLDLFAGGDYDYTFLFMKNSGALHVAAKKNESIEAYPNPATGILNVSLPENVQKLLLIDATGREVLSIHKPDSKQTLALAHLAKGFYILEAETENRERIIKKISVH